MTVDSFQMVTGSTLRRIYAFLIALAAVGCATLVLQEPAHAGDSYTWTGEA